MRDFFRLYATKPAITLLAAKPAHGRQHMCKRSSHVTLCSTGHHWLVGAKAHCGLKQSIALWSLINADLAPRARD
jgi:hypothetical protein